MAEATLSFGPVEQVKNFYQQPEKEFNLALAQAEPGKTK